MSPYAFFITVFMTFCCTTLCTHPQFMMNLTLPQVCPKISSPPTRIDCDPYLHGNYSSMSEIIQRSVHFVQKASHNDHVYENYSTLNLFRFRSFLNRLHANHSSTQHAVFTTIVLGSSFTMGRGVNGPGGTLTLPSHLLPTVTYPSPNVYH